MGNEYTEEIIDEYLKPLEGWKPTEDDKDLAYDYIQWLDGAMQTLRPDDGTDLWIRTLRRLCAICRRSAQLASSVRDLREEDIIVEPNPVATGQTTIRKGNWDGRVVALKYFHLNDGQLASIWKDYIDEVVIWRYTSHPNVVPFIGTYCLFDGKLTLVSDWMDNGTIMDFLKQNPTETRDQYIKDIMSAIEYIHSLGIVHADLKANNVLVDAQKRARLADFGISSTSSVTHTKVADGRGTWQYKAPELEFVAPMPTNESDFFSLAHLIWEMFSLVPPYGHIAYSWHIANAIKAGDRPSRPEGCKSIGLTDELWALIEQCWSGQPRHRRQAWEEMVKMFEVRNVIESHGMDLADSIDVDDAQHGPTRRPVFSQRSLVDPSLRLHRLVDSTGTSPRPIFDLSFFDSRPMQAKGASDKVDLVPFTCDELDEPVAEGIKYIDLTCKDLHGWKLSIWSGKPADDGLSRPRRSLESISNAHEEMVDIPSAVTSSHRAKSRELEDVLSGLFCCLPRSSLPKWMSRMEKQPKTEKPQPLSPELPGKDEEVLNNASLHSGSDASSRPGSSTYFMDDRSCFGSVRSLPPLAPPVPLSELANLPVLTVRDVLMALYTELQRPALEEEFALLPQHKRQLPYIRRRRVKRAKDKAKRTELRRRGQLVVDYLMSDVMFDGFVPELMDDRGGLELSLVVRAPTKEEEEWMTSHW